MQLSVGLRGNFSMINYTPRLDSAIRKAARAHEKAKQHRKGTDIPYIIHPFGVMIIASNATDDEDILIACLMHDILEDVDASIYSKEQMREDFGGKVVSIVKDVTKGGSIEDWHERSKAYLNHLQNESSDEAVIVSASDKIHNLQSILTDYKIVGESLWQRFSTKSSDDQLWWYKEILEIVQNRQPGISLAEELEALVTELSQIVEHRKL